MGQGFADVRALMRCWRLAAGLPSAVAFGYRTLGALASAYEEIVTPIVASNVADLTERATVSRALQASSMKVGTAILSFAQMSGGEQRLEVAALAGAISRLYDDLIEASPDAPRDDELGALFYTVPRAADSSLERVLAELAGEIRQRIRPMPRTVIAAFDALHAYQCMSRQQREYAVPVPVVEKICRGKGALANLTVCSLVKPDIDDGETELVMALGEMLQSLDDYADVDDDKRDAIATLATLGAITLADIGAQMRALRIRLMVRYGRAASRRYCGMLFYLLLQTMLGRRLAVIGRVTGRLAGRCAVLAFLTKGPNAVPAARSLGRHDVPARYGDGLDHRRAHRDTHRTDDCRDLWRAG